MAINPIGQLTNYKVVSQMQMSTQKAARAEEDRQYFNPNSVQHTNPGIKDPGKVVSQNTESITQPIGNGIDIRIQTGAYNNRLDLLV